MQSKCLNSFLLIWIKLSPGLILKSHCFRLFSGMWITWACGQNHLWPSNRAHYSIGDFSRGTIAWKNYHSFSDVCARRVSFLMCARRRRSLTTAARIFNCGYFVAASGVGVWAVLSRKLIFQVIIKWLAFIFIKAMTTREPKTTSAR